MIEFKCHFCENKVMKHKSSVYNDKVFCNQKCFNDWRKSQTKNHDFFKIIDSEEKAYWLGFIIADGSLTKFERKQKSIVIDISGIDGVYLEKFANIFDSKLIYYEKIEKGNIRKNCRVVLTSSEMWNDLVDKGVLPNKTYIDDSRVFGYIPDHLENHFVRGFFDGDGGVCFNKKENKYSIQFTGRPTFLEKIREIICKKVGFRKAKLIKSVSSKEIKHLSWCGSEILICFREWLYCGSTLFFDRKKDILYSIVDEMKRNSKSKYRGVSWNSINEKWVVSIYHHKPIFLGMFSDEIEAAKEYDMAVVKYDKPKYRINFKG